MPPLPAYCHTVYEAPHKGDYPQHNNQNQLQRDFELTKQAKCDKIKLHRGKLNTSPSKTHLLPPLARILIALHFNPHHYVHLAVEGGCLLLLMEHRVTYNYQLWVTDKSIVFTRIRELKEGRLRSSWAPIGTEWCWGHLSALLLMSDEMNPEKNTFSFYGSHSL